MSSPDKDGHNRSLENMKSLITIINSKELENIWLENSMHHEHEHIGTANKSDVSPNTPPADEADL